MEIKDFDESWQVCVPQNETEQANMSELEEYLNNMNYC